MKKIFIVLALVLIAGIFSGCWTVTYYVPGTATDNKVVKVGEGPSTDGINKIAQNAGLKKIATVDYRIIESHNAFAAAFNNGNTRVKIEQIAIISGE